MTTATANFVSVDRDLASLAVGIVVLLAQLLVADHPIERHPFLGRPLRALVDSGAHGLVAALVTAPIIRSAPTVLQLLALAFLAGTLVDLDHFLVAGPRSFWAATHLARRPHTQYHLRAPGQRGWIPVL